MAKFVKTWISGPKPENLAGLKSGRLKAISLAATHPSKWLCACDCGNTAIILAKLLKNGKTGSCGCLRREVSARRVRTHGKAKTKLYNVWCAMKRRCFNRNTADYYLYGGRGISVCDRWLNDFATFAADMGEPFKGAMIERIDNDGNYCPENCTWATIKQQCRNRRSAVMIEAFGEKKSQSEWAKNLGVPDSEICKVRKRGTTLEQYIIRRSA
jgi:hypothetical protein